MLRRDLGHDRPIERMIRRMGAEIVEGEGLTEAHRYWVGDRLVILAPSWQRSAAAREASIARQAILLVLEARGEDWALAAFCTALQALKPLAAVGLVLLVDLNRDGRWDYLCRLLQH